MLRRPLATSQGGSYHEGGPLFASVNDPNYQALGAMGEGARPAQDRGARSGVHVLRSEGAADPRQEGLHDGAVPLGRRCSTTFACAAGPPVASRSPRRGRTTPSPSRRCRSRATTSTPAASFARTCIGPISSRTPAACSTAARRSSRTSATTSPSPPVPSAIRPTTTTRTATLDMIPAYCVIREWHRQERMERGMAGLSGIVYVSRPPPPAPDRPQDFDVFAGGASLHIAAASLTATGDVTLGGPTRRSTSRRAGSAGGAGRPAAGRLVGRQDHRVRRPRDGERPARDLHDERRRHGLREAGGHRRPSRDGQRPPRARLRPRVQPAGERRREHRLRVDARQPRHEQRHVRLRRSAAHARGPDQAQREPVRPGGRSRRPQARRASGSSPGSSTWSGCRASCRTVGSSSRPRSARPASTSSRSAARTSTAATTTRSTPSAARIGYEQATYVVELADKNFATIFSNPDAVHGAGALGVFNRSIGVDFHEHEPPATTSSIRRVINATAAAGAGERLLQALADGRRRPTASYTSPSPLPDGKMLVSFGSGAPASFGGDYDVYVLDPTTGAKTKLLGGAGTAEIEAVAVYPRDRQGRLRLGARRAERAHVHLARHRSRPGAPRPT